MIAAMRQASHRAIRASSRARLSWAFLACLVALAPPSFAQSANIFARIDLAGAYPGLSAPGTTSFFAKSLPGWRLPESESPDPSPTLTDALSNDCPLVAPGLWTCDAVLAGSGPSDPTLIEVQTRYRSATGDPRLKALSRLRLRLGWDAPPAKGWEAFLGARPAPDRSAPLARARALEAFAGSAPAMALASAATGFRAALWRLRAPDGSLFELAAVAALDAKGALTALACETSIPESAPPSPAPTLP